MFTRRITPRTALLRSCLLVTGLALTCLPTLADAARRQAVRQAAKREAQSVSNAQLHEALRVLQATKQTLEGANHDYGGHRVEAIKAIGAAQQQLKRALGMPATSKKAGGKGNGKGGGKGGEPQAISNMQLADAIPILHKTRELLEMANHDYHGHRAAAVRDLGVAVQQLRVALKFEKKREK